MRPNPLDMEFTEAELQWLSEKLKDPNWAKPTRPPKAVPEMTKEEADKMFRRRNHATAEATTTESL